MITKSTYVIAVRDLERSASFYQDSLGFEIHEIGDPGWRLYIQDECRIMAGHCPDSIPAVDLGDHSYFAYLTVDEIDSYYTRLLSHDVEIIKPLQDEPWGIREFGLRTIDGHRMMIGQPKSGSA